MPLILSVVLVVLAALAGCAAPPAPVQRPSAPRVDLDLSRAVIYAVDDLFAQMKQLPGFTVAPKSRLESAVGKVTGTKDDEARRAVVAVDSVIDSASGQQTRATELVEQRIYDRVRTRFPQFEIGSLRADSAGHGDYLLVATMTSVIGEARVHRLNMSMTEVRSGIVVAQSTARIRDDSVDATPTAFYRDSPALARDRVIEAQVRTAETPVGKPGDAAYLQRLPTNALINEGLAAFNRGDFAKALSFYDAASKQPDGQQLRVFNGLYMSYWNLGRAAEAEAAFGRIVGLGFASNNLAVKFLFNPGLTEFWSDPKINGPYPFWLKQLARELGAARNCLAIVGHSSRTGTIEINERLSLARAQSIKARLVAESPELGSRIDTSGVGFRENIIGTGTDDQRDALDRRVEFRVVECGARAR